MSLDKGAIGSLDKVQVPLCRVDAQGHIIITIQGNDIDLGVVNPT
jgi:hypothetical protein